MSAVKLKILLNAACKVVDNVCTSLLSVQIVIRDPDGEELIALQSSQVPWP